MMSMILFLVFLLSPPIINAAAAADPAYKATEHILLSCGSRVPELKSPTDGQIWIGDETTNFSPYFNDPAVTNPAYVNSNPDVTAPYYFGRIIRDKFSYIFPLPLSAGQRILRLYFRPAATYTNSLNVTQKFDARNSFLSVTANRYTLLNNFSPFAAVKGSSASHVKEFIINVQTDSLEITFVPSPGSFAFINGVELVSLPTNLYMGSHDPAENRRRLIFVNAPNNQFNIDETNTAFETMSRVAMGVSKTIARVDDTGMFREWVRDDEFLISQGKGNPISNDSITLTYTPETPAYSAPAIVYKKARAMGRMGGEKPPVKLTWNLVVDSGYLYLLRLHFCEFMPSLFFREGQRVFNVFIDGKEAGTVDIVYFAGGTGIPMIRDYVVLIANKNNGERSKYDLNLALSPDSESGPQYLDAFVNAVEVFKLSTTDGYLAGDVNPPFSLGG